jgi:hypothetical protein
MDMYWNSGGPMLGMNGTSNLVIHRDRTQYSFYEVYPSKSKNMNLFLALTSPPVNPLLVCRPRGPVARFLTSNPSLYFSFTLEGKGAGGEERERARGKRERTA